MKKILNYFFRGLIYTAPISITAYILYKLFLFTDSILPLKFPGLGIIVIIGVITLLGYIGSTFLVRPIISFFDSLIVKTPFIKIIYSSIKDLLSAFVGKEKKFKYPVLVKVNSVSNLEKIGFLTQSDLSVIGIQDKKVAVYFPHSYAFSGELFIVPAENVTPLDMQSTEVLKFIVSGGISKV